jgi:hypothetical protein
MSVIMLSVIVLSVIVLSVVMLSIVEPFIQVDSCLFCKL